MKTAATSYPTEKTPRKDDELFSELAQRVGRRKNPKSAIETKNHSRKHDELFSELAQRVGKRNTSSMSAVERQNHLQKHDELFSELAQRIVRKKNPRSAIEKHPKSAPEGERSPRKTKGRMSLTTFFSLADAPKSATTLNSDKRYLSSCQNELTGGAPSGRQFSRIPPPPFASTNPGSTSVCSTPTRTAISLSPRRSRKLNQRVLEQQVARTETHTDPSSPTRANRSRVLPPPSPSSFSPIPLTPKRASAKVNMKKTKKATVDLQDYFEANNNSFTSVTSAPSVSSVSSCDWVFTPSTKSLRDQMADYDDIVDPDGSLRADNGSVSGW